jgi:hypothetical protein
MDIVNAMLISSGLSNNLWSEALYSAYYILNRVINIRIKHDMNFGRIKNIF